MYWNEKIIDALDLKALQEQLNKIENSKELYLKHYIKSLLYLYNLIN